MISTPDFSAFRTHPAPWRIYDGRLYDANDQEVLVAGVNITAGACFPASTSQANSWASKMFRMGIRAVRLHHLDVPIQDWGYDPIRVQWLLNALKRKGIPCLMEMSSQKPWNPEYVKRMLSLDLSNVVAISPANENPEDPFEEHSQFIRDHYEGLVFGSNSVKQGGDAGDINDLHLYLDYPNGDIFWDTRYSEQPWIHPIASPPFVCTELGSLYPSPNRGNEERAMVDDLLAKGCQAIFMFALCTNEWQYLASSKALDQFGFHSDPERMDTLCYLTSKVNQREFVPRTFDPTFKAVRVDQWTWKRV